MRSPYPALRAAKRDRIWRRSRKALSCTPMLEVRTLTDGGQTAVTVAQEIATFMRAATATLELALYDLKLGPESAQIVLPALTELTRKAVAVRVVFNKEHPGGVPVPPPPQAAWYSIDALAV